MNNIEEVKARLDIVETVGSYVPNLKRSGRTWKANCPFHSERTPSFIVDPNRNSWHCFGACATGGDVIEFVRRFEGLDFKEALWRCAERAGVELRPPTRAERQEREEHERLLSANEAAAIFFQAALDGPDGAEALAYAERRGLDAGARRDWQIGYAPDSWNALTDHLAVRGFGPELLVAAGLAAEGDRGLYDRFRGRLIFPTRDERGRLTGFGGRVLGEDQEPKYLNTPQTPLFDKSGTLYGLDRAGPEARRAERLIVVEGYMDVIGCHQAGLRNVAASMGTAITERQMQLVKRFTPNVVLALDADNAGSEATLRAVGVAAGAADHGTVTTLDWRGLVSYQDVLRADIHIAALPDGEDPRLPRAQPPGGPARADRGGQARRGPPLRRDLGAHGPRERPRPLAGRRGARADRRGDGGPGGASALPAAAGAPREDRRGGRAGAAGACASAAPADAGAIVARAGRRGQAAATRAARPSDERRRVATAAAAAARRPECRISGVELDADTFEDSTHRRLFEAWCETEQPEARAAEFDEELQALDAALRDAELPEAFDQMTAAQLGELAQSMAWHLRARRRQARVRAEASAVAHEVAESRRGGATVLQDAVLQHAQAAASEGPLPADAASEPHQPHELAASFVDLSTQQRELARAFAAALEVGPGEPAQTDERIEDTSTEPAGITQRANPLTAGGDPDGGSR